MVTTLSFYDFDINWFPNNDQNKFLIVAGRMSTEVINEEISFNRIGDIVSMSFRGIRIFMTEIEFAKLNKWMKEIKPAIKN